MLILDSALPTARFSTREKIIFQTVRGVLPCLQLHELNARAVVKREKLIDFLNIQLCVNIYESIDIDSELHTHNYSVQWMCSWKWAVGNFFIPTSCANWRKIDIVNFSNIYYHIPFCNRACQVRNRVTERIAHLTDSLVTVCVCVWLKSRPLAVR